MELVGALIGLIVAAGVGYFLILRPWNHTRRNFQSLQPDVRIARSSIDRALQSSVIRIKLHNHGKTAAYDVKVTLDGWPDHVTFPFIHPVRDRQRGYCDYEISIPLKELPPIHNTGGRLWLRYRDRWHYGYELSYPVYQKYGIRMQLEQPFVRRPRVRFFEMHKHLREMARSQALRSEHNSGSGLEL